MNSKRSGSVFKSHRKSFDDVATSQDIIKRNLNRPKLIRGMSEPNNLLDRISSSNDSLDHT